MAATALLILRVFTTPYRWLSAWCERDDADMTDAGWWANYGLSGQVDDDAETPEATPRT